MTLHVSKDVENSINALVQSGRYASADELITRLVEAEAQHLQRHAAPPPAEASKPFWERIQEITADVPDEEWAKVPVDLAEQHDHYIYGTPKRPSAQ